MAKSPFKSVDDYIASQPKDVQGVLQRVRNIIRKTVPGAEETISYGIAAYKLNGAPVLFLAGWKQHYSRYPGTGKFVAAFKDDLVRYQVSKGTIRFPLSEPVPAKLIERIAKLRAKEVAGRAKTKSTAPKKRYQALGECVIRYV